MVVKYTRIAVWVFGGAILAGWAGWISYLVVNGFLYVLQ